MLKKIILTGLFLLSFPLAAFAFINLCFPVTLITLLIWLNGALIPLAMLGGSDITIWLGVPATLFLLYWLGGKTDIKKPRKLKYKLPVLYLLIGILILAATFIDPSCDGDAKDIIKSFVQSFEQHDIGTKLKL